MGETWTSLRRQWNASGQCAREACRGKLPDPPFIHSGNGLRYCERCAGLINRYNPDLCKQPAEEPPCESE